MSSQNPFINILYNNQFPQNTGDRFLIRNQLWNNLVNRPDTYSNNLNLLNAVDNPRYRLKGDFADMYGDLYRQSLLERDKAVREAKLVDPNYGLTRYAGGYEQVREPEVIKNFKNMNYTVSPSAAFDAGDLFEGYPTLTDLYNRVAPYVVTFNRANAPIMIYKGLSQPVNQGNEYLEQDLYNNWAAQHGQPLQGGIQFND
jgi:hypothetical protein